MGERNDNPVEQMVETFVYAPVGLALEAIENWDKHVERGRSQVTIGRFLARAAARRGGSTAETVADRLVNEVGQVVVDLFGIDLSPEKDPARSASNSTSSRGVVAKLFPIDDYDNLTAAEIVQLLSPLTGPELRRVGERERDGKGRVTILRRIEQLQSSM